MRERNRFSWMLIDALLLATALFVSLWLRFDGVVPSTEMGLLLRHMPVLIGAKLLIYWLTRMYRVYWGHASIAEMLHILGSTLLGNILTSGYLLLFVRGFPRGVLPIVWLMDMFLIGGSRYLRRAKNTGGLHWHAQKDAKHVLIIGAGEAGALVCRELLKHPNMKLHPVAFVDDDPIKQNSLIHGVPVKGTRETIPGLVRDMEIDEVIFALPSATAEDRRDILELAKDTGAKIKTVPGVYEMIDESFQISEIRDVNIEDLLGREPVELDTSQLQSFLTDKVVLITGGGGSIGSELARQIVPWQPKRIVLVDIYENAVYDVEQELRRQYPDLDLSVAIESVRDKSRMDYLFAREKPHIVFHAAAHKHVPLMEVTPASAIKNNIFGTWHVVEASLQAGVEKFVLISTDKAVNPTNVMGTTKRFCERMIQAYNEVSDTDFVAVRFGNVLGSNGSVIPLFTKQIAEGGPVTVTDPEITRYFMTIPEASQLVLQAGAMASGGEIFILHMGQPVKIVDLARDLIRLSGLEPDEDIQIEFTGLRPGEKKYEEFLIDERFTDETTHDKIYIEKPTSYGMDRLHRNLSRLIEVLKTDDDEQMVKVLQDIVPTYHPNRPGFKKSK